MDNVETEIKCPVCKNDSFLNPNIKIFISPCFHKICKQCLNKLFGVGYSPCPECGNQLRKINFISSTFEDVTVEREIKIRQLLKKHYSKIENPEDILLYNDWLEAYENTVEALLKFPNEKAVNDEIKNIVNDAYHELNRYKGTSMTIINDSEKIKKVKMVVDQPFGIFDIKETPKIYKYTYKTPENIFKFKKHSELNDEFILNYAEYVKKQVFR